MLNGAPHLSQFTSLRTRERRHISLSMAGNSKWQTSDSISSQAQQARVTGEDAVGAVYNCRFVGATSHRALPFVEFAVTFGGFDVAPCPAGNVFLFFERQLPSDLSR